MNGKVNTPRTVCRAIVATAIAAIAAATIIGCSSLGGGSRRQNIATVIQTAYDMGGREAVSNKIESLVAGDPPPRARPARLRGNHGRSRHGRRLGHERNAVGLLPRWMLRLLCPRCQRRLRGRLQRGRELRQMHGLHGQVSERADAHGQPARPLFCALAGGANRVPIPSSDSMP